MNRSWMLALVAAGCEPESAATDKDPADSAGTDSSDTDTGNPNPDCEVHLTSTTPNSGAVGWYYRDSLALEFDGDGSSASIAVNDPSGIAAAQTVEWSEGSLIATVSPTLAANTTYSLDVDICGASNSIPFTTSDIGAPLTLTDEELTGRVFNFVLSDAEITDPAVLEAIDDTTFPVPLLFEVTASMGQIALMGAIGGYLEDGTLVQHPEHDTFYFPAADFSETPHFEVATELVTISYGGRDVPMNDFSLSGEFMSDGSAIVKGKIVTLLDTRYIGPLLGQPDTPEAACDFAGSLGIYCEACPDGEELCLHMSGEEITANYYEGMDLVDIAVE